MPDSSKSSILSSFELNTTLFLNCLRGVDDAIALKRISNRMAFIACHLVDARFYLAKLLGVEVGSSFGGVLDEITSIEDVSSLPVLHEIREAWVAVGETLVEKISTLSQAEFDASCDQTFPVSDSSMRGATLFLLQHESYHIGQLALLRKHHGLEAMSWQVDS
jgi:hypothetical protein